MLIAGEPAPVVFARLGFSRSTGYRLLRGLLRMSVVDAKAHLLAEELAKGVSLREAAAVVGVSRATAYRLLKRQYKPA